MELITFLKKYDAKWVVKETGEPMATLTRQHFEAIATVVKRIRTKPQYDRDSRCQVMVDEIAIELADSLKAFNAYFDRGKFLEACGVGVVYETKERPATPEELGEYPATPPPEQITDAEHERRMGTPRNPLRLSTDEIREMVLGTLAEQQWLDERARQLEEEQVRRDSQRLRDELSNNSGADSSPPF